MFLVQAVEAHKVGTIHILQHSAGQTLGVKCFTQSALYLPAFSTSKTMQYTHVKITC